MWEIFACECYLMQLCAFYEYEHTLRVENLNENSILSSNVAWYNVLLLFKFINIVSSQISLCCYCANWPLHDIMCPIKIRNQNDILNTCTIFQSEQISIALIKLFFSSKLWLNKNKIQNINTVLLLLLCMTNYFGNAFLKIQKTISLSS